MELYQTWFYPSFSAKPFDLLLISRLLVLGYRLQCWCSEVKHNSLENLIYQKQIRHISYCFWAASETCHDAPVWSYFPIFIQKRSIWEHDFLISCSDFMIFSLKTLPLHCHSFYLYLDLFWFVYFHSKILFLAQIFTQISALLLDFLV